MKERLRNLTYYLKGGCQNFCTQLHHPPTDMLFWCMAFSVSNYNQVLHPFPDSVKESGGRVLVHCQAGISRSATICLAYLIHAHRVRLNEAFEFVKRRRHVISPNLGFMGQLLQFETDVLCPYTVLDSENGATAFQYLCSDNTNLSWTLLCSKETVQYKGFSYCDMGLWWCLVFNPSYTFVYMWDSLWTKTMCVCLVYMLKCTKRLPALDSALFYKVYLLYKQENPSENIGSFSCSLGPNDLPNETAYNTNAYEDD